VKNFKKLFENDSYLTLNTNLELTNNFSIKSEIQTGNYQNFNISVDDFTLKEGHVFFTKNIYDILYKNEITDFFDYRKNDIKGLTSEIYEKNYKYIIVSASISSLIELSDFNMSNINNQYTLYEIGSVGSTKVLVNPYMDYNDKHIYFFNNIEYNINNEILETFENIIIFKYKYNMKINESLKCYILNDHIPSDIYNEYIRRERSKKLDNII
jgi:hypothetical protein